MPLQSVWERKDLYQSVHAEGLDELKPPVGTLDDEGNAENAALLPDSIRSPLDICTLQEPSSSEEALDGSQGNKRRYFLKVSRLSDDLQDQCCWCCYRV